MFQSTADPEKKFGSRFRQRKFDNMHGQEGQGEANTPGSAHAEEEKPKTEMNGQEDSTEQKGNLGEEAKAIVEQHGPAHTVHIKHNHVNKKHHVTSQHEDGHVTESDHTDAMSAHKHGSALAGAPAPTVNREADRNPAPDAEGLGSVDMAGL